MSEDDRVLGGFCRNLDVLRRGMVKGQTVFGADLGVVILDGVTQV